MSAIRQISQHFETTPPPPALRFANDREQGQPPSPQAGKKQADHQYVVEGFRRLLPLDGGLEPHLRGVLRDTLENPGNLVRAHLAFGILRAARVAKERALPLAVAIEYFHTASLLFDDLPSMDDAKERRGQPCPHRVHGEAAAILGALALINQGHTLLWQVVGELPAKRRQQAGDLVARCLGERGILDGQARDLHFQEGPQDAEEVLRVAEGKTVSLVRLTLLLPAIAAGLDRKTRERLNHLATVWGLSYQILDDSKDRLMSRDETARTGNRDQDQSLKRLNIPAVCGQQQAAKRLSWLLSEGRELVAALCESQVESWRPVIDLQARLESEARKVQKKLQQDTGSMPAPVVVRQGTSQAFRFAQQQMEYRASQGKTLVLTLPAPRVPPEFLLRLAPQESAFLWIPPRGAACVALGVAQELRGAGSGRTHRLRRAARRAAQGIETVEHASATNTPAPRFYGGLAFRPGAADHAPWSGLGDARFVLPRFLYRRTDQGATMSLAVGPQELRSEQSRKKWALALEHRLRSLAAMGPPQPIPHPLGIRVPDLSERRQWMKSVGDLVGEIGAGDLEKLVIARRALVELQDPADAVEILRRLRNSAQGSDATTRFAIRYGASIFLGATPERLIARRGLHVQTAALGGSVARGAGAAEYLLNNPKELHEHRWVAETLASRLGPLCSSLDLTPRPQIRQLRHLLHLETPVHGLLHQPVHVLELVDRLHPTPAVGGLPASDVLRHLERFEGEKRGWYASPVGWFDGAGDGDFAVALRCSVLHGRRAHLFAEAGIIADSDPRLELAETEFKLHTLREALEV